MKFEMSERVKYRWIGGIVVLSIGVSTSLLLKTPPFSQNVRTSLNTPIKITQPSVTAAAPVVAKVVELPPAAEIEYVSFIAKAEPLNHPDLPEVAKIDTPVNNINKIAAPVKTIATVTPPPLSNKKSGYGVQLASLTSIHNADNLVAALRKNGFVAKYGKFKGKQGEFYQVIAGAVAQKSDAINLQKKIAASMKLNGFIVQTAIG